LFINIVRWRVKKGDSVKQHEVWREMMKYQRHHLDKLTYIRSRFFTFTEEESSEETWMFLDDYHNGEDFHRGVEAWKKDPELKRFMDGWFPKWRDLIVPGSRIGEFWDEVEDLRVELK